MSKRMTYETDPATGITYGAGMEPLRARLVERAKPLLGRTYPTVWCLVRYPSSGPRYVWYRVAQATVCRWRGHTKTAGFCEVCFRPQPGAVFDMPDITPAQAERIVAYPAQPFELPNDGPGVF